ncbi:mRNA interferase HigB [Stella humosa]|uniref:mRNA interferase HigB n=1 Tax=Stella humosa TaxID=94 RepID=A0A3N1LXH6_9PROT|nr:type II toxin-antitoxin system HigB family toxin [Stella humosa]ROP99893.1 mRNA interferase HigB [Stella humosa]BBK30877.1 toxin RelE [Stella humosa]
MQLISRNRLDAYARDHADAASALAAWITSVRAARWSTMQDILATVPSAKVLNGERVRFAIRGGNHRLVASIFFRHQMVFVKFIGTHPEYDAIDALTVDQFKGS